MSARNEVEQFLNQFKVKLKVFGVAYVGRDKNTKAVLGMEMVQSAQTKILENLETEDYSEGPLEETMHGTGNMWVFGKKISVNEVYIKVAMGQQNNRVTTKQQSNLHILSPGGTPTGLSV